MLNHPAPEPIAIRRAVPDDARTLAEVARRLFAQTFGPANTADDMRLYLEGAFSIDKQRAELSDPNRIVWLAEKNSGDAVGYVSLLRGSGFDAVQGVRPAEIERIYVDSALHGAGLAATMMQACIDTAVSWECDTIWLAVWEKNPRAIAFYQKSGFVAAGAKTFLLGNDAQRDVVMARKL